MSSDAYGLKDAMVEGATGLRCKVADVDSLKDAMMALYNNSSYRSLLGSQGRERVVELFSAEFVVGEWLMFYHRVV